MKQVFIIFFTVLALSACSKRTPTAVTVVETQVINVKSQMPSLSSINSGSYAFIAFHTNVYDEGILVVDISKPESSTVVNTLQGGYPRYVEYSGKTLCDNNHFLDIRDPVHPVISSTIDTLNIWSFALKGNKAYCGCLHPNNNDSFVIYDFSDPAKPQKLGQCKLPNWPMDIAVKGRYAYVADHWAGLRVIDVGDPSNPREVANLLNLEAVAENIVINNYYAYLCQQGQVSIIDIFNPLVPVRVSTYNGECYKTCVNDNYLYIANGYGGITIVDVHDPFHPKFVSRLGLPGRTLGVAASGNYAFAVGDNGCGLRVVNVGDKQHPFLAVSLVADHTNFDITLYRPDKHRTDRQTIE
ncbi:hypothetical protein HZA73_06835 [candidate division TA06 bacterium]|nr:hypothetical protein [candidate division TA06 bacterium]